MRRPDNAPIPLEAWEKTLEDFARRWAYARIESGPSATADSVAREMFSEKKAVGEWLINACRIQESEDVVRMRNEIESRFRKAETEHLTQEVIKEKLTLTLLKIVENPYSSSIDVVMASRELEKIHDLAHKPKGGDDEDGDSVIRGAVVIPVLETEEFSKNAFRQQKALQENLKKRLGGLDE